MKNEENTPIQPVSGKIVPRYAGPATFARLPELRDVKKCDIAILEFPLIQEQAIAPEPDLGHRPSGRPQGTSELSIILPMIPNLLQNCRWQMQAT